MFVRMWTIPQACCVTLKTAISVNMNVKYDNIRNITRKNLTLKPSGPYEPGIPGTPRMPGVP